MFPEAITTRALGGTRPVPCRGGATRAGRDTPPWFEETDAPVWPARPGASGGRRATPPRRTAPTRGEAAAVHWETPDRLGEGHPRRRRQTPPPPPWPSGSW